MLGGVIVFFTGRLEKQDSNMKGAVDVPRQWPKCPWGRCANNPRERNVFSSQAHDHSQATLYPSNGHMAKKHVAHDKLPEDSVWPTCVYHKQWRRHSFERLAHKTHCGGARVLRGSSIVACLWLSPLECFYVVGIRGSTDVRYCWVRYGAASGAELAANQEGQTALRKTQADEEHDRTTAKPSGQARNPKAQCRSAPKVSHHALRPGGTPQWAKSDGHDHLTTKSTG